MSWNAVFAIQGQARKPCGDRPQLAVRYQVEGSVRQTGDRVRVTAQLVDADGRVLWSARFDEALADCLCPAGQDHHSDRRGPGDPRGQIEQRRVLAKPTESLEAYDYVLRARPALQRPTRANNVEARALLRRAIELDPNYAAAYAALAETYHIAVIDGLGGIADGLPGPRRGNGEQGAEPRRFRCARRMSFSAASISSIIATSRRRRRWTARIAINPNDAHGLAGRGNILMWTGQTDAAIEALETAQRIDPELNAIDRFALSLAYYLKRRYDAAIEQAELNLRETAGANFSRDRAGGRLRPEQSADDAARVVTMIRRLDPTFDPQDFRHQIPQSGRSRASARWLAQGRPLRRRGRPRAAGELFANGSGRMAGSGSPWRCLPQGPAGNRPGPTGPACRRHRACRR